MICPECHGEAVDPVKPGPGWPVMCRGCFSAIDARSEAMEHGTHVPGRLVKGEDLVGLRFGQLTVTRPANRSPKYREWECVCECGTTTVVSEHRLRSGGRSCVACASRATAHERSRKARGADLFALSRESGLKFLTLKNRQKLGWSVERLTLPLVRPGTIGNTRKAAA